MKNFVVPEPPSDRENAEKKSADTDVSTEVGKTDFSRSEKLLHKLEF